MSPQNQQQLQSDEELVNDDSDSDENKNNKNNEKVLMMSEEEQEETMMTNSKEWRGRGSSSTQPKHSAETDEKSKDDDDEELEEEDIDIRDRDSAAVNTKKNTTMTIKRNNSTRTRVGGKNVGKSKDQMDTEEDSEGEEVVFDMEYEDNVEDNEDDGFSSSRNAKSSTITAKEKMKGTGKKRGRRGVSSSSRLTRRSSRTRASSDLDKTDADEDGEEDELVDEVGNESYEDDDDSEGYEDEEDRQSSSKKKISRGLEKVGRKGINRRASGNKAIGKKEGGDGQVSLLKFAKSGVSNTKDSTSSSILLTSSDSGKRGGRGRQGGRGGGGGRRGKGRNPHKSKRKRVYIDSEGDEDEDEDEDEDDESEIAEQEQERSTMTRASSSRRSTHPSKNDENAKSSLSSRPRRSARRTRNMRSMAENVGDSDDTGGNGTGGDGGGDSSVEDPTMQEEESDDLLSDADLEGEDDEGDADDDDDEDEEYGGTRRGRRGRGARSSRKNSRKGAAAGVVGTRRSSRATKFQKSMAEPTKEDDEVADYHEFDEESSGREKIADSSTPGSSASLKSDGQQNKNKNKNKKQRLSTTEEESVGLVSNSDGDNNDEDDDDDDDDEPLLIMAKNKKNKNKNKNKKKEPTLMKSPSSPRKKSKSREKGEMENPQTPPRRSLRGRRGKKSIVKSPATPKSPAVRHTTKRRRTLAATAKKKVESSDDESEEEESEEEEEEDDEEEEEEEEMKMQRIIACKSLPRKEWKIICSKMNTSEIDDGSRWFQGLSDDEGDDNDDDTFEERYLVKWMNLSYLHCSWEQESDLMDEIGNAKTHFNHFFRKSVNGLFFDADERGDGEFFDPSFLLIDRLLEIVEPEGVDEDDDGDDDGDAPKNKNKNKWGMVFDKNDKRYESGTGRQFLIKWVNLPYSDATYEFERDLILNEIDYEPHLQALEKRQKKPTRAMMTKAASEGEKQMRRLYKIFGDKVKISGEKKEAKVKSYQSELEKKMFQPCGGQLRDYQAEGVSWLVSNLVNRRSSILADEMGLGKTIQTAVFINTVATSLHKRGPFLIVAPLSTIPHWLREFEGWTGLNTIVFHGSADDRDHIRQYEFPFDVDRPHVSALNLNGHYLKRCHARNSPKFMKTWQVQVVITTPEMLITDDFTELTTLPWEILVVDEAHRLKNHSSKLANCLRHSKFTFRHTLLLTGTPIQNNMQEMWTLLNIIDADKFGNCDEFLERYGDIKSKERLDELHERIRPYILRRLKEDVERSVPPKEETVIEVELTVVQKQYYRALYEKNISFLHRNKKKALDGPSLTNLAMELRKCCNHPFLLKGVEQEIRSQTLESKSYTGEGDFLVNASGKLVLLDKLLPRLKEGGHRILIFSQFKIMLDILQDYLLARSYKHERIDGSITGLKRQNAIDRFQAKPKPRGDDDGDDDSDGGGDDGEDDCGKDKKDKKKKEVDEESAFIMLLSTRAGGVGINLTAADTCIIFDSDFNPQNDLQAQARCHRIGQTKSVKVYRLLARKTYELQMFHMSSLKMGLDQAVLHGIENKTSPKGGEGAMSKEEVERLLRHGAYDIFNEDKAGKSEAESKEFVEEDIDAILARRSKTVVHENTGSKSNAAGGTFSKANFKATNASAGSKADGDGATTEDVDIDDPDFWRKTLGEGKELEEANPHIIHTKRKRREVKSYREESAYISDGGGDGGDDGAASSADDYSDMDDESDSDSDSDSYASLEGSKKKKIKERANWGTSCSPASGSGMASQEVEERIAGQEIAAAAQKEIELRRRARTEWEKRHAEIIRDGVLSFGYNPSKIRELLQGSSSTIPMTASETAAVSYYVGSGGSAISSAASNVEMRRYAASEMTRMTWSVVLATLREAIDEEVVEMNKRAERKRERIRHYEEKLKTMREWTNAADTGTGTGARTSGDGDKNKNNADGTAIGSGGSDSMGTTYVPSGDGKMISKPSVSSSSLEHLSLSSSSSQDYKDSTGTNGGVKKSHKELREEAFCELFRKHHAWITKAVEDARVYASQSKPRSQNVIRKYFHHEMEYYGYGDGVDGDGGSSSSSGSLITAFMKNLWPALKSRGWKKNEEDLNEKTTTSTKTTMLGGGPSGGGRAKKVYYTYNGKQYRDVKSVLNASITFHPELKSTIENVKESVAAKKRQEGGEKEKEKGTEEMNEAFESSTTTNTTTSSSPPRDGNDQSKNDSQKITAESITELLWKYGSLQLLVDRARKDRKNVSVRRKLFIPTKKIVSVCYQMSILYSLLSRATAKARKGDRGDEQQDVDSLLSVINYSKSNLPNPNWKVQHDCILLRAISKHGWLDSDLRYRSLAKDKSIHWNVIIPSSTSSGAKKQREICSTQLQQQRSDGKTENKYDETRQHHELNAYKATAAATADFLNLIGCQDFAHLKGFDLGKVIQTYALMRRGEWSWVVNVDTLKSLLMKGTFSSIVENEKGMAMASSSSKEISFAIPTRLDLIRRARLILSRFSFSQTGFSTGGTVGGSVVGDGALGDFVPGGSPQGTTTKAAAAAAAAYATSTSPGTAATSSSSLTTATTTQGNTAGKAAGALTADDFPVLDQGNRNHVFLANLLHALVKTASKGKARVWKLVGKYAKKESLRLANAAAATLASGTAAAVHKDDKNKDGGGNKKKIVSVMADIAKYVEFVVRIMKDASPTGPKNILRVMLGLDPYFIKDKGGAGGSNPSNPSGENAGGGSGIDIGGGIECIGMFPKYTEPPCSSSSSSSYIIMPHQQQQQQPQKQNQNRHQIDRLQSSSFFSSGAQNQQQQQQQHEQQQHGPSASSSRASNNKHTNKTIADAALDRGLIVAFSKRGNDNNGTTSAVSSSDSSFLALPAFEVLFLKVVSSVGISVFSDDWKSNSVYASASSSSENDKERNQKTFSATSYQISWSEMGDVLACAAKNWLEKSLLHLENAVAKRNTVVCASGGSSPQPSSSTTSTTSTMETKLKKLENAVTEARRDVASKQVAWKKSLTFQKAPMELAKLAIQLLEALRLRMGIVDANRGGDWKKIKSINRSEHGLGPKVLSWFGRELVRWADVLDVMDCNTRLPLSWLPEEEQSIVGAGAAANHTLALLDKKGCRSIFTQISQMTRLRSIFWKNDAGFTKNEKDDDETIQSLVFKAARSSRRNGDEWPDRPSWWGLKKKKNNSNDRVRLSVKGREGQEQGAELQSFSSPTRVMTEQERKQPGQMAVAVVSSSPPTLASSPINNIDTDGGDNDEYDDFILLHEILIHGYSKFDDEISEDDNHYFKKRLLWAAEEEQKMMSNVMKLQVPTTASTVLTKASIQPRVNHLTRELNILEDTADVMRIVSERSINRAKNATSPSFSRLIAAGDGSGSGGGAKRSNSRIQTGLTSFFTATPSSKRQKKNSNNLVGPGSSDGESVSSGEVVVLTAEQIEQKSKIDDAPPMTAGTSVVECIEIVSSPPTGAKTSIDSNDNDLNKSTLIENSSVSCGGESYDEIEVVTSSPRKRKLQQG